MFHFVSSASRLALFSTLRRSSTRQPISSLHVLASLSALSVFTLSATLIQKPAMLDSPPTLTPTNSKTVPERIDPDTSIAFPETITVPAKIAYPPLTLLGVGVRTVSFLRVKVYSIGFYADLTNPNLKFTSAMSPEEKIQHIIDNTSCVLRIVPTRPTSYSHLRDAFVRALQGRMLQGKASGAVDDALAITLSGPISQLKSMFPNTNLNKHVPLDVFLTPPAQGKSRAIVIRDMGAVQNDWVSTQLFRYYFDGAGPSPPLKRTVVETLSQP